MENSSSIILVAIVAIVGIVGIIFASISLQSGVTGSFITIPQPYSIVPSTPTAPYAPYPFAPPGGQKAPPPAVLPQQVWDAIAAKRDFVEIPVTKELSKAFWIDYVGPVGATPLGTDCGPDSTSFQKIRKGIKWFSFPVPYAIDPSYSGIDSAAAKQAVVNAFNTWDAEEHPSGAFFVEASPAKVFVGWSGIDGSGGVLAVTSVTYNIITGEILAAEVTLDAGDTWTVYPSLSCSSQGSAFDIENTAAHEIGHVIGLNHVRKAKDVALTMYPYTAAGETLKRTLGTGDKYGIDYLY